jgi:hypothetical protein
MISRILAVLCLLLCAALPASLPANADADADQAQKLLTQASPSIVTIRVVIKVTLKEQPSNESRIVTEGTVVTPDGLVMLSSAPISTDLIKEMSGGDPDDKSDFTITPTDFQVTIDREEKDYSAVLAASDANLGLSFIQIQGLAGRKLTPVDFSAGASVATGDMVAAITRLGKGFDFAPLYTMARVTGEIFKPRDAWALTGDITDVGLPVYSTAGDPVGVMTLLASGLKDESTPGPDMMHFFGGSASEHIGVFMVPATAVNTVIGEAEKQAASLAAQPAVVKPATAPSSPAATPAPTPAPAAK